MVKDSELRVIPDNVVSIETAKNIKKAKARENAQKRVLAAAKKLKW